MRLNLSVLAVSLCIAAPASAQSNADLQGDKGRQPTNAQGTGGETPAGTVPGDSAAAPTSPEASILTELHVANLTEIQEGKLAQDRATSAKVKQFGKMLVKDHTAADAMVKKEAERLNITLSDTLPAAQQAELDDLKATPDFDVSFARDNAAGHAKAIADASAARKTVTDKSVDKLIAQLLPKLRKHEREARQLERSSGKNT